ncbi:hypothetical protein Syun_015935 [Stephania yunnanensis]|uniref:Uncharacterized protein n=1 Tax=Stephania yunnanensis TaxID=152371 RepID=A0AAP0J478_9MAGN
MITTTINSLREQHQTISHACYITLHLSNAPLHDISTLLIQIWSLKIYTQQN